MLGAIGLLGTAGWVFLCWLGFQLKGWGDGSVSSHVSSEEWLFALAPVAVFVFYLVITIRTCRALTALVVGIVVHIPLVFVLIRLFRLGHAGPVYALALLLGPVIWLVYVRELSRHDNAA
jgi:hypothetical protein